MPGGILLAASASVVPVVGVRADACEDERFPALVGRWILYCSADGPVDRVRDAVTGEDRALAVAIVSPVVAPVDQAGRVLRVGSVGPRARWETVTPDGPTSVEAAPVLVASSPPQDAAAWGDTVALAFADHLELSWDGGPARSHLDARVLPGELAVGDGFVAWTERDASGDDRILLLARPGGRTGEATAIGAGRLPVAWGTSLAFVADGEVRILDLPDGSSRTMPADAGFLNPPALSGVAACTEDRAPLRAGTGDLRILCLGGQVFDDRGDERAPSLGGDLLLFRNDRQVFLAAVGRG